MTLDNLKTRHESGQLVESAFSKGKPNKIEKSIKNLRLDVESAIDQIEQLKTDNEDAKKLINELKKAKIQC